MYVLKLFEMRFDHQSFKHVDRKWE